MSKEYKLKQIETAQGMNSHKCWIDEITGNRVEHKYLGKGTAIKTISFMTLVQWDKTPDKRYNMGENPCAIFTKELFNLTKQEG